MSLELSGRIIKIQPTQQGTGKNGAWFKKEFIIETKEQYPKKICVSAWGDKCDIIEGATIGDFLNLSVTIESREYNERWYTEIKAWTINVDRASLKPKQEPSESTKAAYMHDALDKSEDDLPF